MKPAQVLAICCGTAGRVLAAVLGLTVCTAAAQAEEVRTAPKEIPAEAFYRHRDFDEAELSPGGRYVAFITSLGGKRAGIVTIDLEKGGEPLQTMRFADIDVEGLWWVNDDRLVFTIVDRTLGGHAQRYGGGLFSVRPDGSELKILVKHTSLNLNRIAGREALDWRHGMMGVPRDGGREVIVAEYRYDSRGNLRAVHPLRLDVVTGRTTPLAVDTLPDVTGWLFDALGVARAAYVSKEGKSTMYWRSPDGTSWVQGDVQDAVEPRFELRFADASGRIYVTTRDGKGGTAVLKAFDPATGRPAAEPLIRTPGFDFAGTPAVDPADGRLLGVRVSTDAETTVWYDEAMRAVQQAVDAKFPGRVNHISCARCGARDKVVLVYSYSDQEPGRYVIYRPEGEHWEAIGSVRTGIDPKRMAHMDLHRITARDGRELPVWVTMPSGPKAAAARPAIVLVHGGPWTRRYWGWSADAQFLASRGYVVIEPEFRGSTGYGHDHFKAGFRQWGLAMQDDVADATLWAVAKGWADSKRVCIAGASYGGYATLMGLVRHPELYRCGAAWVGVTDPRLLFGLDWISDVGDEARGYGYVRAIGDPVKDAAALAAVAPAELAARIKAPVLLAYGAKDRRVPLEHGDRMRAALRAAGNDPEWVLYPDEGHGWFLVANRVDFAERLERFLARHLKP